jgi:uncharacterized protein YeaO (DUF488 family)
VTERGRPRVELRRVYEDIPDRGPTRVLIDRLWPRGIAKATAPFDEWAKEVAPTTDLRRWYGHDPAKFETFAARYRQELATPPASDGVARLHALATEGGLVLVTATRDVEHSAAEVLLHVLVGSH